MNLNMEKEASSWLTVLPLQEHCFALYKQVFRDALALKYGWQHFKMPAHCSCSQPFSVQHALSCPKGGFPSIRHNDLRDINAAYLSETYHGVAVEHSFIYSCYNLSPIRSLYMPQLTHSYGARLDIFADGFWSGSFERAFHVRVFNPFAQSNSHSSIQATYRHHKNLKKWHWEEDQRSGTFVFYSSCIL